MGIDLASQPRQTAGCIVEWQGAKARVVELLHRLTDSDLIALMVDDSISRVAIDAPFGWPLEFIEALNAYAFTDTWPVEEPTRLFLRETDRHIQAATGQRPLSVTTDRIAYSAMRCARLLVAVSCGQPIDRTGEGRYIEVYPAAALRVWGFDSRRYKGSSPAAGLRRIELVDELLDSVPWLHVDLGDRKDFEQGDHALDALIAALVARAVERCEALPVPTDLVSVAAREGWIRTPRSSSFEHLVSTPLEGHQPHHY